MIGVTHTPAIGTRTYRERWQGAAGGCQVLRDVIEDRFRRRPVWPLSAPSTCRRSCDLERLRIVH